MVQRDMKSLDGFLKGFLAVFSFCEIVDDRNVPMRKKLNSLLKNMTQKKKIRTDCLPIDSASCESPDKPQSVENQFPVSQNLGRAGVWDKLVSGSGNGYSLLV